MTSPAEPPSRVGQTLLGKLQVVRRIGQGGMAEVYEVEHLLTRHRRALKIVRPEVSQEPRFVERFMREVSIAGRLATPFVAETFDAGWLEDDSAYVLMELLPGRSLHALLEDEGSLSERRACDLMCQVAEGIQVAHDAGIVHRDLKPENVFVVTADDGRERVKILDFGVSKFLAVAGEKASKLTREGSVVGTPYYMSPEQAGGRPVDGRSDVWAIGVMTYEILTGRLPFSGETFLEVMLKIGGGTYVPLEHRRPDIDPAIPAAVARALRPDPNDRFRSAEALRRELLPFAGSEPAARAKTISDGAGAPDGVSARALAFPRPAALPSADGAPATGRVPSVRPAPLGGGAPSASRAPQRDAHGAPRASDRPLGPVALSSAAPVALSSAAPETRAATAVPSARPSPARFALGVLGAAIAAALLALFAFRMGALAPSETPVTPPPEPGLTRAASSSDGGVSPTAIVAVRTTPPDVPEPAPSTVEEPPPAPSDGRPRGPRGPRTPAEAAGLEASPYRP